MPGPYHFEGRKTGCIILFHGSNLLSHPRAETKEKKSFLQTQAHVTALVHHVLLYEVYIYIYMYIYIYIYTHIGRKRDTYFYPIISRHSNSVTR